MRSRGRLQHGAPGWALFVPHPAIPKPLETPKPKPQSEFKPLAANAPFTPVPSITSIAHSPAPVYTVTGTASAVELLP